MKPRFESFSTEVNEMLIKAKNIENRINILEKAEDCPKCKGGKLDKAGNCMKMSCSGKMAKADMATKDKYCMKNFGKKYSECSGKQKAQCDKACAKDDKMAKASPAFSPEKISDTDPRMVTETGGQTRTAPYTTNGKTIEIDDAKPRKKDSKEVKLESLAGRMNPHAGTGVEREDAAGEAKPLDLSKANPSAQHREALESGTGGQCATCGGIYQSGCRQHAGMDINACPQYRPIF